MPPGAKNLSEAQLPHNAMETMSGRRSILANSLHSGSAGGVPSKAKGGAAFRPFREREGSASASKGSGITRGTGAGSEEGIRQCVDLKLSLRQRLDK